MIQVSAKQRTVIQRKLIRLDKSPLYRAKFNDADRDPLIGIPIYVNIVVLFALFGIASFRGHQIESAAEQFARMKQSDQQRYALVEQMYESANATAKANVAELYNSAMSDGAISGEEVLQIQDALIVAGRETAIAGNVETPAVTPVAASASQAELMDVIQWLSTGDETVRESAREALSDQVLDSEEYATIKALREKP